MKLPIHSETGKKLTKEVELSDSVFGIEPNDHAIYLDIKQFMANSRQGTHKAKEKAEITGSTKKLKRQKGTGTARAGSIKSPVFRGGGRIFGPRPRDYSHKLNRKLKVLARKSALTYKAKDESITVVETPKIKAPKTKDYLKFLSGLKLEEKKTLFVVAEANKELLLSSRNIPNAGVVTVDELNTYELLDADQLILTEDSVKQIVERLN